VNGHSYCNWGGGGWGWGGGPEQIGAVAYTTIHIDCDWCSAETRGHQCGRTEYTTGNREYI
jgi:hypothetical protein